MNKGIRRIVAIIMNFLLAFITYKIYSSIIAYKFCVAFLGGAITLGTNFIIIRERRDN